MPVSDAVCELIENVNKECQVHRLRNAVDCVKRYLNDILGDMDPGESMVVIATLLGEAGAKCVPAGKYKETETLVTNVFTEVMKEAYNKS